MQPVVQKLSIFAPLEAEETKAIEVAFAPPRSVQAHHEIARQDDPPGGVFFLLTGFAARRKSLPNGKRQIVALLIPGDSCDVGVSLLNFRDHSIFAISSCVVSQISDLALQHLSAQYPKIRLALRWATLVEEAITREWLINVGLRPAAEAMAHLFCELYHRLQAIGEADAQNFHLPLSQSELAEALALSAVHANRSLQLLRAHDLIAFGDHRLTVMDLEGLEEFCGFEESYLHLDDRYQPQRAAL